MKRISTLLIASLFSCVGIFAQVLVCNQNLNASLDDNGIITLTPDMILEGPVSSDFQQLWVEPATLDCSNIGVPVEVSVYGTTSTGDTSVCWSMINVEDKFDPVPIVEVDVFVDLSAGGDYVIAFDDIDDGSYDNCGIDSYTITPASINCDSPNPVLVTLTIEDASGNSNSAVTYINHSGTIEFSSELICNQIGAVNVFDGPVTLTPEMLITSSPSSCPSLHFVTIMDVDGNPFPGFTFDASHVGLAFIATVTDFITGSTCDVQFNVVSAGEIYSICVEDSEGKVISGVEIQPGILTDATGCVDITATNGTLITPTYDDDPLNGVDEIDLMIMRERILAALDLGGEEMLAADLTGSDGVTTLDQALLMQGILDNDLSPSWRFLDSEFDFQTNVVPNNYDEFIVLGDASSYTFRAIKTGDLDLSNNALVNDDDKNSLIVEDITLNAGETYFVDVKVEDAISLVVANISMPLSTEEYEIVGLSSSLASYVFDAGKDIEGNFIKFQWLGLEEAIDGGIAFSAGETLFTVELQAKENGILHNTFTFADEFKDSKWKAAEAEKGTNLKMVFEGLITVGLWDEDLEMHDLTISPNPVQDQLRLEINSTHANYEIYSVTGRLVLSGSVDKENVVPVGGIASGLYIVHVKHADGSISAGKFVKR